MPHRSISYLRSSVVCRSVCLSVTTTTLQKRLNRSRCRLGHGLGWAQRTTYYMGCSSRTWKGNFEGERGPAYDMPGHVWWLIHSKQLSSGQHRYGADDDWRVLDGVTLAQSGEYD